MMKEPHTKDKHKPPNCLAIALSLMGNRILTKQPKYSPNTSFPLGKYIVIFVILIYKSKVKTVIRHYWHLAVWKVFRLHYGIIGTILY